MSGTLPPDRSHVATEQRHAGSGGLDALASDELVRTIIQDQRDAVEAALAATPEIAALVDHLVTAMGPTHAGRLVYVGAGTSGRLGVLDASECPPTFGVDPERVIGLIAGGDSALRRSSESREDEPDGVAADLESLQFGPNDTLLAIAAGGTTPYAIGALALAKSRGGTSAFLTCAPMPRPDRCDHFLCVATGAEVLTGSTRLKAGTATKIVLNAITTAVFTRLGAVYGNLMVDLRATNDKLVDRAIRTLCWCDPTLTRETAHALLTRAGGSVKVAIVMRETGASCGRARDALSNTGGHVRDALQSLDAR
ncbi:MAG: N-acetylmuramic acid 6-phosphate etherase [Planctomycetota bacterium]|nr:N-acetylmuramic acid 6-phosphate etherase [Planctomycetota bacterium]MDA1105309.1 N-acetylmuramic acid 6-phosphate etherase [Planctomycetota bacterium]